jgi:hypothetical protein
MEFINTPFEDYVLDEFIKVQLLFDESFKYVKVSEIPQISASPIISNTSKSSIFHKGSSLIKHLIAILNELSNFNQFPLDAEFKKNIIKFYSINKLNFKSFTIDSLITNFQSYLSTQNKLDNLNKSYYIQSIQLIDLMLICKSSNNEKSQLINIRNNLLDCSFLQLSTISDSKFKNSIIKSFQITDEILENKIQSLNYLINKQNVVDFFKSDQVLSNTYNLSDFENPDYYQNWLIKSKNLENDMITLFTDNLIIKNKNDTNISIIPNQLDDAISLLITISLNSNSSFFQGLIRCMQLWQINPFTIQFKFIQISSIIDENDKINPELVEKAFNLSYLAMPFQIQFLEWPLIEKKNFLNLSMKIYNESIDSIKPFFSMFFQDQNSFTTVLSFLKLLKLNLKNIKQEIKNQLIITIDQRLKIAKSKSQINEIDKTLKLENVVKFLTLISRDINLLYNWKMNNKDLNLSFQIFESGSKIIMTPTLDIIKRYINEIKLSNFNLISNKDNKINFGTFIDLVNNLKSRTNFKYNFQNEIFQDFYKIVQSWDSELLNKTKVIISNDNLIRLDGCSYSSSIQNLILLFEGYIKLLESFKWQDETQSSELYILLYKNIIHSIKYYHSIMINKMSELNKLKKDDENIDSFVCLNNIYKLFDFIQSLEKNENIIKISKYLVLNGKNEKSINKNLNKYVCVIIKNAENIEDFRGNPLSLKVKLSGLINDETRNIFEDHNPDWLEEFNVMISNKHPTKTDNSTTNGNLKIELIDVNSNNIYKSINYNVNLNSENLFKNQNEKILLKPKSGSLNINVNVEFEKNDPLFYIINCKNEIENSIKRSINFFIESYLLDFKKIFKIPYLQQSLIDNPIRSENNYMKLQDPVIDTLIGNFKIKIIPTIYNNLETKLFDRLISEFWVKILNIAENLLLPRISIINYAINSKLNKKNLSSNVQSVPSSNENRNSSSTLSNTIHQTTREELIRVVEWCYKFRSMIDLPDMILQDDSLNKPFEEFNDIKKLFHLSIKDLRKKYYEDWNYLNKNMLIKLSKGTKYDRNGWSLATRNKELTLRILLAKGEIKFAKKVLEIEQRFEKTVKTEIEVVYLQQFL